MMLRNLLQNIDKVVDDKSRLSRFSPISASLPSWQSAFLLERLNILQSNKDFLLQNHSPRFQTDQNSRSENSLESKDRVSKPFVPTVNYSFKLNSHPNRNSLILFFCLYLYLTSQRH